MVTNPNKGMVVAHICLVIVMRGGSNIMSSFFVDGVHDDYLILVGRVDVIATSGPHLIPSLGVCD